MAGSHGRFMFNFSKNCQNIFQRDCIISTFLRLKLCTFSSSPIHPSVSVPAESPRAREQDTLNPVLPLCSILWCLETCFFEGQDPRKQGGSPSDKQMFISVLTWLISISLPKNWSQHHVLRILLPPFPAVSLYSLWQFIVCLVNAQKPVVPN